MQFPSGNGAIHKRGRPENSSREGAYFYTRECQAKGSIARTITWRFRPRNCLLLATAALLTETNAGVEGFAAVVGKLEVWDRQIAKRTISPFVR